MAVERSAMLAVLLISSGLLLTAFADDYIVGDDAGWEIQATTPTFYDDWAGKMDFKVGDTLKFNWAGSRGTHDVWQMSTTDVAACNLTGVVLQQWLDPGATVTLNETGTFAYLCSISAHCISGNMKMTLTVAAAGTPSPPPPATTPSPPGTTPTPPTAPPPPAASAAFSLMQFYQPLIVAALAVVASSVPLYVY